MRIRRFVDLSVPLVNAQNGVAADPPGMIPQIDCHSHQVGAQQMAVMFPGLKPEDPCKIKGASAGFTRAVALFEEVEAGA